jgi:hypothetical protein
MTRMTAVSTASTDVYRSLAAASAQIDSRTVELQVEQSVDGAPAIRRTDYLPAFDHAADSARFILLPATGEAP